MGAVAYERMVHDGIDVEELKRRNVHTRGLQYDRLWYTNKIKEYEDLLKMQNSQTDGQLLQREARA